MMKNRLWTGISCALGVAALLGSQLSVAAAPDIKWELDDAIRQIERQADDFSTAMAQTEIVKVDGDGSELERTTGTKFIRSDGRMRYRIDGSDRIILTDKRIVEDYDGAAKTVTEYRLSKHKDRLEPFMRLGFSATGKDLKDDFLITIIGEETLGDARTLVLELTPKRDGVRASVSKARLWIDQASWMPRRQEFNSPADGSTTTINYSGMARNLKLNPDLFDGNWPRGTEKIDP
ncbi:MAG: outer membrane lipoprotein-sorting protein [Pseudomonadota bacterium]